MKVIKKPLQKVLTDNQLWQELTKENPWGFILESSNTQFKIVPSQQWNQICYKGHWSISIMSE